MDKTTLEKGRILGGKYIIFLRFSYLRRVVEPVLFLAKEILNSK